MSDEAKNNFFTRMKLFFGSDKFQKIFYPCLYFVLAIGVVFTGCFVFERKYYTNVFVSGSSMSPTLLGGENGGRYHYGISDNHRRTLTQLERFDVVVTYFPNSWGSVDGYKIKRLWGFPGETINMSFANETYTFTVTHEEKVSFTISAPVSKKTFQIGNAEKLLTVATFETKYRTFNTHVLKDSGGIESYERQSFTVTLKQNEYFLMGDNWASSSDSYANINKSERISFDNLQGKMIAIQGTAKYNATTKELYDKQKMKDWYYF